MESVDYTEFIKVQVSELLSQKRADKQDAILRAAQDVEDYLLDNRLSVKDLGESGVARIIKELYSQE